MTVYQREIVEVNFRLPEGEFKPHPVIVISNDDINQFEEDGFLGVMLSSSAPVDDYSYNIEKKMLTTPSKKKCQVRCHLIAIIEESEIIGRHGSIKIEYFKQLIDKIYTSVLSPT